MMRCEHCGLTLLNGFKFCHHCGRTITVTAAAPELAAQISEQNPESEPMLKTEFGAVLESELITEPEAEEASEIEDFYEEPSRSEITVGGMYIFELLCRIPVLNIFLLAIIASSVRDGPMREIARAKLLTILTVTLFVILAVLTIVLLLYTETIEPFYLGKWKK